MSSYEQVTGCGADSGRPIYMNNAATSWPKAPGVDQAVAEAISEAQMDPDYDSNAMPERPDPRKPEAMEQPVPVGICLGEAKALNETYVFLGGEGILAVPATSPHLETVSQYVDFLLQ